MSVIPTVTRRPHTVRAQSAMRHQDAWNQTTRPIDARATTSAAALPADASPQSLVHWLHPRRNARPDIAIPDDIRPRASTDVPHRDRFFLVNAGLRPRIRPRAWPRTALGCDRVG